MRKDTLRVLWRQRLPVWRPERQQLRAQTARAGQVEAGARRVRDLEERARLGQRAEPEILLVLSAIMRARARGDDGM